MILSSKNLLKNSIFVYSSEVLSKALLFLFNSIVARKLGVVDYGVFTFAYSFSLLLSTILDYGTNNYIFSHVSKDMNNKPNNIKEIIQLQFIIAAIVTLTLFVFLLISSYNPTTKVTILFIYLSLFLENISNTYRNILKGIERFDLDSVLSILSSSSRLIIPLVSFYIVHSVLSISFGVLISTFIPLLLSYLFSKKFFKCDAEYVVGAKKTTILSMFKSCTIYAIPNILKGTYTRIDSVIVQITLSGFHLGLYNSALKFINTQYFIPQGMFQVVFPTISRMYGKKMYDDINRYFFNFYIFMFLSFNIFQMVQVFFCLPIVKIIYGEEFIQAELIQKLILLSFVFTSMTLLLNYLFLASGKIYLTNKYYIFGSIIKIPLIIVLSNTYGLIGAGFAFLICEIFLLCIFLIGTLNNNIHFRVSYFGVAVFVFTTDFFLLSINTNNTIKTILLTLISIILLYVFKVNPIIYLKGVYSKNM